MVFSGGARDGIGFSLLATICAAAGWTKNLRYDVQVLGLWDFRELEGDLLHLAILIHGFQSQRDVNNSLYVDSW